MDYYILSIESTENGKRIKISLFLIVVILIIITALLGVGFALITNNKSAAKGLEENPAYAQIIDELPEEQIEQEPEVIPEEPKLPVLTEEGRNKFNNIYNSEERIAYLTFDDGPSKAVTPLILDVLKANNIPATFFVLGSRVKTNPDLVKRAYDEGHYIANHGYSHVYKDIYSSKEAVLTEYNHTESEIKNALGLEDYNSHIFRFPGGSVGNKQYATVKNEAKQFLAECGIMYIDWNSLNGDSEGKNTKEALLQQLHYTTENKGNVLVVLLHDGSDKILTAETLQDCINMLIDKGYTFRNFYDIMQ